tara:strand:+ start:130 stop:1020 length:891 start_codon:yes stop_codon:yes gene_type:complete
MGVARGVKVGLKAIAGSIGTTAKNFASIGSKVSDDVAQVFSKAADDLVIGVAKAGDDVGSLKKAFTEYSSKLADLAKTGTESDKAFVKAFQKAVSPQITKAVDDITDASADAVTSTKKSVMDRVGDAVNSPTAQKLLVGAGVFGGLMFIRKQDEDIADDKAACIAACLPSNWDEYQSNTSVELKYTTQDELEALDLKGGPICAAAKFTNPGCYTHCNNMCEKLNPSFLSRFIDPFTSATTDVAAELGEAAGSTAAAGLGAAAGAGGAAAGGVFKGLGVPLTIAAIIIVMIIVVMMF